MQSLLTPSTHPITIPPHPTPEFKRRTLECDVIGVVETWLTDDISDAELKVSGYELYRKDRTESKGGGIILYVKESLHSELCDDLTNSDFEESLWCKVQSSNGEGQLIVGVCYRCPTSSSENNARLLELFESANRRSQN